MLKLIQANNEFAYFQDNNLTEDSLRAIYRLCDKDGMYNILHFILYASDRRTDEDLLFIDGNRFNELNKYIMRYFFSDKEKYQKATFGLNIILVKKGVIIQ